MPISAIETGLVDFVLPPASMPATLVNYVKQPYINGSRLLLSNSSDTAAQLKTVLELMRAQTKYDFRSYRPKMIMRRIERRMGLVAVGRLQRLH